MIVVKGNNTKHVLLLSFKNASCSYTQLIIETKLLLEQATFWSQTTTKFTLLQVFGILHVVEIFVLKMLR